MSVAAELQRLGGLLLGARRDRIHARAKHPELPDPIPLEMPIGFDHPPSIRELVQEYVRSEMSQQASKDDMGTFEEEDDFEEDDEALLDLSGFEVHEFEMVDEDPQGVPAEDTPVQDGPEASGDASQPPEAEAQVVNPPE